MVQGHALRGPGELPREQLFAEERQRGEQQSKPNSTASTPSYPHTNVTNVLPRSHPSSSVSSIEAILAAAVHASSDA